MLEVDFGVHKGGVVRLPDPNLGVPRGLSLRLHSTSLGLGWQLYSVSEPGPREPHTGEQQKSIARVRPRPRESLCAYAYECFMIMNVSSWFLGLTNL